jgi:hypothetical protein
MGIKGTLAAALLVGTAARGFTKGFGETSNFSDSFYETTLGDPDIDEAVFGTKISPLELLTTPGFIPTRMNIMSGRAPAAMVIAPVNAVAGAAIGGTIGAFKGGVKGGILGGLGGAVIGAGSAIPLSGNVRAAQTARVAYGVRNGLVNSAVAGDYFKNNQAGFLDMNNENNAGINAYRNTPPQVDGSIVFGAYNARYGR